MHAIRGVASPIVITVSVKDKAHMIPEGYLDAPVLRDLEDPVRAKANWIANAWHCGVAELLVRNIVQDGVRQVPRGKVGTKVSPKWISPWGGSKLDQLRLLVPAFGVAFEAVPRR